MSVSLVRNGDKGVWIDRGVGEVWLAALSTKILERPDSNPELLALSQEFEKALAMDWIVGALQYDFGSLLKNPKLTAVLRSLQSQIEADWRAQAASGSLILQRQWQAAPEFAVPEIEMLSRLFFDPASVPTPPHVYVPDKGWIVR